MWFSQYSLFSKNHQQSVFCLWCLPEWRIGIIKSIETDFLWVTLQRMQSLHIDFTSRNIEGICETAVDSDQHEPTLFKPKCSIINCSLIKIQCLTPLHVWLIKLYTYLNHPQTSEDRLSKGALWPASRLEDLQLPILRSSDLEVDQISPFDNRWQTF